MENQLIEAQQGVGFVEDAHADLFAPLGRNGGNAKVNGALFQPHADAAVLRQALFRDVELGENLESRDQAHLNLLGQHLHYFQLPINSEAHGQVFFLRLDVDIAGALLDGQRQNAVGHADDRGVLRRAGEVRDALRRLRAFNHFQGFQRFRLQRLKNALRRLAFGSLQIIFQGLHHRPCSWKSPNLARAPRFPDPCGSARRRRW